MLFILTALRQAGKTRWLESLVARLDGSGVPSFGVVAPGVWKALPDGSLAKLGIDNVLLPDGRRIHFATPAERGGSSEGHLESSRAGLGWAISDQAIAEVNRHLAALPARFAPSDAAASPKAPGLLVLDELGPLELVRDGGLTQAVALLEAGPTPAWPHAVAVVRPELVDVAVRRFSPAWGGPDAIEPDDATLAHVAGLFGL